MLDLITTLSANLYLWLWLAAFFLFWFASNGKRRWRRVGIIFFIVGWIISLRPVSDAVLRPLEQQYHSMPISTLHDMGIDQVVVLTGGGGPPRGELMSSAFTQADGQRFLGGVELCSSLGPDCKLIFSGSSGQGSELPTGLAMQQVEHRIDSARDIKAEAKSNSTSDHPANVRALLNQGQPFLLVTSAYHMPRAMSVFQANGLTPIPYPVDYLTAESYTWKDFLPSLANLEHVEIALREYLATLWYKIRGY